MGGQVIELGPLPELDTSTLCLFFQGPRDNFWYKLVMLPIRMIEAWIMVQVAMDYHQP